MRYYELVNETSSAGATSSGNIASINTPLWAGPVKGTYPYIVPDYNAAGIRQVDLVPRGEPGKGNPFAGIFIKRNQSSSKKSRKKSKKKH